MQVQKAAKVRGTGLGALHYLTSLPIVTSRSDSPMNTSPVGLWRRPFIVPYPITPRCEAKGQVAIVAMLVLTGEGAGGLRRQVPYQGLWRGIIFPLKVGRSRSPIGPW